MSILPAFINPPSAYLDNVFPEVVAELEKYNKEDRFVLSIKPGITGISQVSGRSDLTFEEEVSLDTFYIENWSLWLDIKIWLLTFGVVLRGGGE